MNKKCKRKITKITLKNIIYVLFSTIMIFDMIIFYNMYFTNKSYAKSDENELLKNKINISKVPKINIDEIIKKNSIKNKKEEFREEIIQLEYLTKYVSNNEIPQGESYVIQEGTKGTQKILYKKIYENDKFIKEEKVSAIIQKPAFDKIIEVGTGKRNNNKEKIDTKMVEVTSDELSIYNKKDENSTKIGKLIKKDKIKIIKKEKEWYYIKINDKYGWIKKESTKPIYEKEKEKIKKEEKIKEKKVDFNMKLNEPSGLTLEEFQKVLTDSKDINKIFKNNAKYFYYIEKQYNINGIFVASIGIHESAWGTSKIAKNKKNLFGYGAYDSNPYNGAYNFKNYSESIDLLARVLVKYYLNPKGTKIYENEIAIGTYYNTPTLTGVNQKYASDKNWANAVYNHMKYLYNKI